MLSVPVTGQTQADEATQIMRENGATQTELAARIDDGLRSDVSASSWTGTA